MKNNQRLRTSNYEEMVALNAKLKIDDSVCRIQEWMATLNAKRQGNDEGAKYAPVSRAATTLYPLRMYKRDSMSLKRYSTSESE